jgi:hypothetical protein
MKSIRLNKETKQQIVHKAAENLFAAKDKEFIEKGNKIFLALYDHLYTKAEREFLEKYSKMYNLAFPKLDRLSVERRSNRRSIYFNGIAPKPFFFAHQYAYDMIKFKDEPESEIEQMVEDYYKASEEFDTERNEFMRMLANLLKTITTTKQLLEVWPVSAELVPFVFAQKATLNLPSVHLEPLNAMVEKWRNKK